MMLHAQSVSTVSAAPYIADSNINSDNNDNYLNGRHDNYNTSTTSDANASPSLAPPFEHPQAKRQRYSSQSNSASGSSVTTVHRVASRSSSRTGASGKAQSTRPLSPANNGPGTFFRQDSNGSTLSSQQYQSHGVSDSQDHQTNGSAQDSSLQRWSQSTGSSMASTKPYQRASSSAVPNATSSRRPSNHANDIQAMSRPASRPGSRQRPMSPLDSPERSRHVRPGSRGNPLNALPVLQTRSLRHDGDSDSPSTASTGMIASAEAITPNTYASEYFASNNASPRSIAKSARPQTARTSTTPIMSLNYSRMPRAEDVKESAHYRRRSEHLTNLERESKSLRMSTASPATLQPEEKKDRTSKPKDRGEREKKAMLAKALEKANIAVVLDNKQDFAGAFDAYNEACMLLQEVMDRSVNPADQKKLDAIKVTYTNRIEELKLLEAAQDDAASDKELPERPLSDDSSQGVISPYSRGSASIATAREARVVDVPRLAYPEKDQDNFFSRTMADVERAARATDDTSHGLTGSNAVHEAVRQHDTSSNNARPHIVNQRVSKLPPPEETRYLPAPLATKKQPSPTSPVFREESFADQAAPAQHHGVSDAEDANGSASWLDTIAESSASSVRSSSVHSVSSQRELRRKPLPAHQVQSNPDLDAAFDAAVEAAYDEGLEPDLDTPQHRSAAHPRAPSAADVKEVFSPTADKFPHRGPQPQVQARTAEDDEEERILDEFTHDYGHGFNFAFGTKSALPRQSDSSGYSRSTWQSSQLSERTTAGTSLSTVAENDFGLRISSTTSKPHLPNVSPVSPVDMDNLPPSVPPPNAVLPVPPKTDQLSGSTVRTRRFSGQNAKDLKIEVPADANGRKRASTLHHPQQIYQPPADFDIDTHKEVTIGAPLEPTVSDVRHERMLKSPPSLDLLSSNHRVLTPTDTIRSADDFSAGGQHVKPAMLKKNQSSLSLRGDHTVLLPSPSLHDHSESTPYSAMFTTSKSKLDRDPLHSQRAESQSYISPLTISSLPSASYLFDTKLLANRGAYSPRIPGDAALALEPCPESLLLRPFWAMRCIGSTITNPRGGFITNKLFVPREVWQTRGVKLKNIDDKVANCDLLTAGLGQLSEVDTFDADAVMAELQRFEEVMERVQTALIKKLGGEVGVHGVGVLFKDAPAGTSTSTIYESDRGDAPTDKNAKSNSAKGYLSSWRKLRSKSSGAPISHGGLAANKSSLILTDKDANSMSSVPMTTFVPVERRGQKRDVRQLSFDGPNKEYMGSLARLFHGVQVLDQIARQVEDPGLKHSSQTHVGLELSIRHAAEFFSFYICRFVLADLGVLVDKFVKRGTEWVMA